MKLIGKIRAALYNLRHPIKPYQVVWNEMNLNGWICLKCAAFETPYERERFCKRLVRKPWFVGFASFRN